MNVSVEAFTPLLGCFVYDAKKGHGSFVTFSLTGTPETPTEEFYFWVYMCDWQILEHGRELAHSESEDEALVTGVSALNGKRLERLTFHQWVTQEGGVRGVSLVFEQGLKMGLYQYRDSSADDDIFLTKNSAGKWISYHTDGSIGVEHDA